MTGVNETRLGVCGLSFEFPALQLSFTTTLEDCTSAELSALHYLKNSIIPAQQAKAREWNFTRSDADPNEPLAFFLGPHQHEETQVDHGLGGLHRPRLRLRPLRRGVQVARPLFGRGLRLLDGRLPRRRRHRLPGTQQGRVPADPR